MSNGTKRPWGTVISVTVVLLIIVVGIGVMRQRRASAAPKAAGPGGRPPAGPVSVLAGTVTTQDVPIYLDGLGTVQAFNTVTVRARVDGQVQRILFQEGREVHSGDLLAQIDPAPLQAQLDQTLAKKAEDAAQLAVARLNLARNADLLASKILAQQDYDTQKALVEQLQATVQADQAAIDNAQVQLNYTRITAPMDGRVGIRLIDQGNMIHANDSNGIVVITQLQPISVLFTLPEQELGEIQKHAQAGEALTVLAVDRNNRTPLSYGKLAVVDNQIDSTTGTIRLKATFPNTDLRLWPGQFVNARLRLTTRKGGLLVPAQVIQRGPEGPYAFVIKQDDTVDVRPVKVALIEDGQALIDEGLTPGERVVVDGQNKLQRGSRVKTAERGGATAGKPPQSEGNRGAGAKARQSSAK
jgi:multidrug efflux system membrane fusion protein